METAVIIPTYNESDNIVTLVGEILALQAVAHIVIVDDNSPDGTGQIADELAKQYQEVHVIHRSGKLGLGTAYIAGFKHALTLPTECIVTMDADSSHHPRYIPPLIAQTRVYDLSIGSRYVVDGGGTINCNLWRRFLSRMGNTVARLTLGLKASDCTAGFRCYRRQVLEAIDLDCIFSSGYSFLVEMLYKCQQLGYRIVRCPLSSRTGDKAPPKFLAVRFGKPPILSYALVGNGSWAHPVPDPSAVSGLFSPPPLSGSPPVECCWLASYYLCWPRSPWIARSRGLAADLAIPPEQNEAATPKGETTCYPIRSKSVLRVGVESFG